jgi:spore maturation protein CgeB
MCGALGAKVINSRHRHERLKIEARMPELYRSSRYVLSMSPRAPGYTSVRTYSILACGGLLLLHGFPEADRLFTHREHAILFDTAEEAATLLAELDEKEHQREWIAENGRRLHATKHTLAHRVLSICAEVEGLSQGFNGWLS